MSRSRRYDCPNYPRPKWSALLHGWEALPWRPDKLAWGLPGLVMKFWEGAIIHGYHEALDRLHQLVSTPFEVRTLASNAYLYSCIRTLHRTLHRWAHYPQNLRQVRLWDHAYDLMLVSWCGGKRGAGWEYVYWIRLQGRNRCISGSYPADQCTRGRITSPQSCRRPPGVSCK